MGVCEHAKMYSRSFVTERMLLHSSFVVFYFVFV